MEAARAASSCACRPRDRATDTEDDPLPRLLPLRPSPLRRPRCPDLGGSDALEEEPRPEPVTEAAFEGLDDDARAAAIVFASFSLLFCFLRLSRSRPAVSIIPAEALDSSSSSIIPPISITALRDSSASDRSVMRSSVGPTLVLCAVCVPNMLAPSHCDSDT
jgi:hypothetical protein